MNSKKLMIPYPDAEVQKRIEENQICSEYFQNKPDLEAAKKQIFGVLGELKDKRIKRIFECRYLKPKKMIWQKIAKKMKTSPQTVMALHRKGLFLIKNKITDQDDIYDLVQKKLD